MIFERTSKFLIVFARLILRKVGLTDIPGYHGKVTSDINLILSPYYRSKSSDKYFLSKSLLNRRLLWAMTWNNEYQSEYLFILRDVLKKSCSKTLISLIQTSLLRTAMAEIFWKNISCWKILTTSAKRTSP